MCVYDDTGSNDLADVEARGQVVAEAVRRLLSVARPAVRLERAGTAPARQTRCQAAATVLS